MKTAGLILVAAICFLTGNLLGARTPERIKTIKSVLFMFSLIRTQIEYSRMPVSDILNFLATDSQLKSLGFIKETAEKLKNGEEFEFAWKNSVEKFAHYKPLGSEERELLISFSKEFGSTDVTGQLSVCDKYTALFEAKLASILPKEESSVKIYNSLGLLAAALFVIIFY